jgi:hypothetical protein
MKENNIIHRNINLENIIIKYNDEGKKDYFLHKINNYFSFLPFGIMLILLLNFKPVFIYFIYSII